MKTKRVRCSCPCHKNPNIKHVMSCCQKGYVEIPDNLQFDNTLSVEYSEKDPRCHNTPMIYNSADNGNGATDEWYECKHCGHTKFVKTITGSV